MSAFCRSIAWALLLLGSLSGHAQQFTRLESVLSAYPNYAKLENIPDQAAIYRFEELTASGNQRFFVQAIDLRDMALSQAITGVQQMGAANAGKYVPNSYSPKFWASSAAEMYTVVQSAWGSKFFSIMNAQFIKEDASSTEMSFPIKFGGEIITGGNSGEPLLGNKTGDSQPTFRILKVGPDEARIQPYDGTAAIFADRAAGIVCFDPYQHPGVDQLLRIHLLFAWDSDGNGTGETLLVMSSIGYGLSGLDTRMTLRRQTGVFRVILNNLGLGPATNSNIMCLDGGGSAFVRTTGNSYIQPVLTQSRNPAHYVSFRQKGEVPTGVAQKFNVMIKGTSNMVVNAGKDFFVTWYDNIETNDRVNLDLLDADNNNALVVPIARDVPGANVYKWSVPACFPNWTATKNYRVRVSLVSNATVKGEGGTFKITGATNSPVVVNNPSFEGTAGAGVTAPGWSNCFGTPDVLPGVWGVTLPAADGSTYAGIVTTGPSYQEAFSQPVSFVAGTPYTFSVSLVKSPSGTDPQYVAGTVPATLRVWAGATSCASSLLIWSGTVSNTSWQTYNFSFTPSVAYSHLKFEVTSSGPGNVMIDNLRVCTASTTGSRLAFATSFESESAEAKSPVRTTSNPFTDRVVLQYRVKDQVPVKVGIYNLVGQRVKDLSSVARAVTIADDPEAEATESYDFVDNGTAAATVVLRKPAGLNAPSGKYSVTWEATNEQGARVKPGVYLYKVQIGGKTYSGKLVYKP